MEFSKREFDFNNFVFKGSCSANDLLHDSCVAVESFYYTRRKLLQAIIQKLTSVTYRSAPGNDINESKLPEFLSFTEAWLPQISYRVETIV